MLNLTRRILGEWGEEEWPTTPALRATVTAAHIAASRRDSPRFDARGPWETVRAGADLHPDSVAGRRLRLRAALGLLPYQPDDESLWSSVAREGYLPNDPTVGEVGHGEPADAFVDAAHRLLESNLPAAARRFNRQLLRIAGTSQVDDRISVWAQVVRARLLADVFPDAARSLIAEAEDRIRANSVPEPSWPDWIRPDDLLAGVRIERGLIAPPEDLSVLGAWEAYAIERLDSIDGERLASLCLRIRLRHGVIDTAAAERWEAVDRYVFDRVPSATAHDLVPPLFVSVAQAWLSAGDPERALALLDRRRREAVGTRQDDLTVRHADAATIAIVRRLRLTDYQSLLIRQTMGSSSAARVRALQTLGILGLAPGTLDVGDPNQWHGWWQSTRPAALATLSGFPPQAQHWRSARTSAELADIQADVEEMRQLASSEGDAVSDGTGRWGNWLDEWLRQPDPPAPPTRTAEPYPELRGAMRMAALTGAKFTPPPDVPHRLLAEMAFEEAELMALRLPAPAAVLFALAASEYARAGDVPGEILARLAVLRVVRSADISDYLPDAAAAGEMADAAFSRLRERNPALASVLTGPPEDAGRWRYWAGAVQGADEVPVPSPAGPDGKGVASADPEPSRPPSGLGSAPSGYGSVPYGDAPRPLGAGPGENASPASVSGSAGSAPASRASRHRFWPAIAFLAAGGAALAADLATIPAKTIAGPSGQQAPSGGTPPLLWIAALLAGLAVLAGLAGWYIPKVRRLAAGQGIGAVRPGALQLDAWYGGQPEYLSLQARVRPWRTAPRRARTVLGLITPVVWLIRKLSAVARSTYDGRVLLPASPEERAGIQWLALRPDATARWWRRGHCTALGTIGVSWQGADLARAWERILVASLSPEAAGRVEWIRIVDRSSNTATRSAGSELLAPSAWKRPLQPRYGPARGADDPVGLRHVIGRAVATSAGPAMDISGDAATTSAEADVGRLLGVSELKRGAPSVVILQAEPAASTVGRDEPPDDQAEKLRLGAELARDGVPAVLLLPGLPTRLATEIALIITGYANSGQRGGAQRLLTRLRAAIAPQVRPPVLDDVVLFLNAAEYRS